MPPHRLTPALFRWAAAALLLAPAAAQDTSRVSVDSAGAEADGPNAFASIAADGRYVTFHSEATNLVPGDTNGSEDVFVHDRQTGLTTRVSVDSFGVQGNYDSLFPAISADGRIVAFHSTADNLVPGDMNNTFDVFVHDRQTGLTSRVSVDSAGVEGNSYSLYPSLSDDGRFVAFSSTASVLVPGDTNLATDVFVHDRMTGQTSRVSVNSAGAQGNDYSHFPALSGDGRWVAFASYSTTLVPGDTNGQEDIFVHDRQTGQTTRVSVGAGGGQANDWSWVPAISADGRHVAFYSFATNLVAGDVNVQEDIFVHDRQTGQTTRVSVDSAGVEGNAESYSPSVSADGRYVAFESLASNLVPGDTNGVLDLFVHDRQTGQTTRVSVDSAATEGDLSSRDASISADGRLVAFSSDATNLTPNDTNGDQDVFVHDRGDSILSLSKSGSCPGAMTLTVHNATANHAVAFLYGATGTFVVPTPHCSGLVLLISPGYRTTVTANGAGTAVLNINATAGLCGRSVQSVDGFTCTATNVIVL